MKFVLIMTLISSVNGGYSTSIHSVSFESKELCLLAGDAWNKQNSANYIKPQYICAQVSK